MSGIAAIDIQGHTAFHLESVQTPGELGSKSLPDHYGGLLVDRKQQLLPLSKYVVADAYFSKHGFTSKLVANGFELVSRLRNDADLNYKYVGVQKKGRGRPKKYDGKVLFAQLREGHFECLEENEECKIYQGKVYSKSLPAAGRPQKGHQPCRCQNAEKRKMGPQALFQHGPRTIGKDTTGLLPKALPDRIHLPGCQAARGT